MIHSFKIFTILIKNLILGFLHFTNELILLFFEKCRSKCIDRGEQKKDNESKPQSLNPESGEFEEFTNTKSFLREPIDTKNTNGGRDFTEIVTVTVKSIITAHIVSPNSSIVWSIIASRIAIMAAKNFSSLEEKSKIQNNKSFVTNNELMRAESKIQNKIDELKKK